MPTLPISRGSEAFAPSISLGHKNTLKMVCVGDGSILLVRGVFLVACAWKGLQVPCSSGYGGHGPYATPDGTRVRHPDSCVLSHASMNCQGRDAHLSHAGLAVPWGPQATSGLLVWRISEAKVPRHIRDILRLRLRAPACCSLHKSLVLARSWRSQLPHRFGQICASRP